MKIIVNSKFNLGDYVYAYSQRLGVMVEGVIKGVHLSSYAGDDEIDDLILYNIAQSDGNCITCIETNVFEEKSDAENFMKKCLEKSAVEDKEGSE